MGAAVAAHAAFCGAHAFLGHDGININKTYIGTYIPLVVRVFNSAVARLRCKILCGCLVEINTQEAIVSNIILFII